jgi:hypothetical protein
MGLHVNSKMGVPPPRIHQQRRVTASKLMAEKMKNLVRPVGLEPARRFPLKVCGDIELFNAWWRSVDIVTLILTYQIGGIDCSILGEKLCGGFGSRLHMKFFINGVQMNFNRTRADG